MSYSARYSADIYWNPASAHSSSSAFKNYTPYYHSRWQSSQSSYSGNYYSPYKTHAQEERHISGSSGEYSNSSQGYVYTDNYGIDWSNWYIPWGLNHYQRDGREPSGRHVIDVYDDHNCRTSRYSEPASRYRSPNKHMPSSGTHPKRSRSQIPAHARMNPRGSPTTFTKTKTTTPQKSRPTGERWERCMQCEPKEEEVYHTKRDSRSSPRTKVSPHIKSTGTSQQRVRRYFRFEESHEKERHDRHRKHERSSPSKPARKGKQRRARKSQFEEDLDDMRLGQEDCDFKASEEKHLRDQTVQDWLYDLGVQEPEPHPCAQRMRRASWSSKPHRHRNPSASPPYHSSKTQDSHQRSHRRSASQYTAWSQAYNYFGNEHYCTSPVQSCFGDDERHPVEHLLYQEPQPSREASYSSPQQDSPARSDAGNKEFTYRWERRQNATVETQQPFEIEEIE